MLQSGSWETPGLDEDLRDRDTGRIPIFRVS